jgi:hypothetical protein
MASDGKPTTGARRLAAAPQVWVVALASILGVLLYSALALRVRFALSDWLYLAGGRSWDDMVWSIIRSDDLRLPSRALFALSLRLFGPTPLPLAAALLACNLAAIPVTALLFASLGIAWPTALLAALIAFFSPSNYGSLIYVGFTDPQLGNLALVTTVYLWVREPSPPIALRVASLALAFVTYATSVAALPLVLLCRLYRDGAHGLHRFARSRAGWALAASYLLLLALRVVHHFIYPPTGIKQLSLREAPSNLAWLGEDTGKLLVEHWLAVAALLWLFALLHRRWVTGSWASSDGGLAGVARTLGLALGWTLIAFAPFYPASFTMFHQAPYLRAAHTGAALAVAAWLGPVVTAGGPAVARWVAGAVVAGCVLGGGAAWRDLVVHRDFDIQQRLLSTEAVAAAAAEAVARHPEGEGLFVLAEKEPRDQARLLRGRIGWEVKDSAAMLEVLHPRHRFHLAALAADDLGRICLRDGDGAVLVEPQMPGTLSLTPVDGCGGGDGQGVPGALARARVVAAIADRPGLDAVAAVWRAYRAREPERLRVELAALRALPETAWSAATRPFRDAALALPLDYESTGSPPGGAPRAR